MIFLAFCDVDFTSGDPCSVCITCPDAGQRILIANTNNPSNNYIALPTSGVPYCIDLAIGRSIDITQFGNSQSGDSHGTHECI